jgi:hypothetical protein
VKNIHQSFEGQNQKELPPHLKRKKIIALLKEQFDFESFFTATG